MVPARCIALVCPWLTGASAAAGDNQWKVGEVPYAEQYGMEETKPELRKVSNASPI
jgi:hypothetical protein